MAAAATESPVALHKRFIDEIKANPVDVYVSIGERFAEKGLGTEMPEFAPVVHYLKSYIHNPEINTECEKSFNEKYA